MPVSPLLHSCIHAIMHIFIQASIPPRTLSILPVIRSGDIIPLYFVRLDGEKKTPETNLPSKRNGFRDHGDGIPEMHACRNVIHPSIRSFPVRSIRAPKQGGGFLDFTLGLLDFTFRGNHRGRLHCVFSAGPPISQGIGLVLCSLFWFSSYPGPACRSK